MRVFCYIAWAALAAYFITAPDAVAQTAPFVCASPKPFVVTVGATAASCNGTPVGNRKVLHLCNSEQNSASAMLRILNTGAGTEVVYASGAGDTIPRGKCITYATPGAIARCISNQAGTIVEGTECK